MICRRLGVNLSLGEFLGLSRVGMVNSVRPKRKASVGVRAAVASLHPDEDDAWQSGGESREASVPLAGGGSRGDATVSEEEQAVAVQEERNEDEKVVERKDAEIKAEDVEAAVDAIATDAFSDVAGVLSQTAPRPMPAPNAEQVCQVAQVGQVGETGQVGQTDNASWPRPGCKLVWTEEEDQIIRNMVKEHGETRWTAMAQAVKTKNAKQCRRRWKNHLSISARRTEWNRDEDARLIQYHQRLGNKWTAISKEFGDRTDNACKNRWHALVTRQPELKDLKVPLCGVGVRKGTKTHSMLLEGDEGSIGTSNPSIGMPNTTMAAGQAGLPATPFDAPSGNASAGQAKQLTTPQEYLAQLIGNGSFQNLMGSQQISSLPQASALAGLGTVNIGQVLGGQQAHPTMMTERNAQALFTLLSQKLPDMGASGLPSLELTDSFQKNLGTLLANELGAADGSLDKVQSHVKNALSTQALQQQLLSFGGAAAMLAANGAGDASAAADGQQVEKASRASDKASDKALTGPSMATLDSQQLLDVTFTNQGSLDPAEKLVLDNLLQEPMDAGTKRKRDEGDNVAPDTDQMPQTQSDFYKEWGKAGNAAKSSEHREGASAPGEA